MALSISLIFLHTTNRWFIINIRLYLKARLTVVKNLVNAILGDFRALDTLFEGLVLIITGLIIHIIKLSRSEGTR